MSLEPPHMPEKFDWGLLKQSLFEWFFRLQSGQLFVPPGTIAAFASTTLPDGWVECDGTDYEETKFPNLFKVIGANGAAPGFMRVPNIAASIGSLWMIKV